MTFTSDGVKLKKKNNQRWLWVFLIVAEVVLSIFLYISLAAHNIWPEKVGQAAVGVAKVLSYEGRLTDTSGNTLGGTGTQYCFRFAIYDAATAGAKLWPTGTPATTTANVIDGVFDATVGSVETLTYNFYDSDTVYLDVAVNTISGATCTSVGSWESLSPRQRIAATGYAITAQNVYGTLLKTISASTTVQFGTGTGAASPVLAGLDWKNTSDSVGGACSPSGTIWYNSSISTALVCNNSVIQRLGSLATTTISGIVANGGVAATSGTVVFSNSNGVTFGINANTITASVAAAGGGATVSRYIWPHGQLTALTSVPQGSLSIQYFPLYVQLTATRMDVIMSISLGTSAVANTAGVAITQRMGIFSKNANTLMSLSTSSNQQTISWASNSGSYSSITGMRLMSMLINVNATPGDYYIAYEMSTAQTSLGTATTALAPVLSIYGGILGTAGAHATNWGNSATSENVFGGMGVYSAQVASNLGNLSLSAINQTGANVSKANFWVQLRNN